MPVQYNTSASKGFRIPQYLSPSQAQSVLAAAAAMPPARFPGIYSARFAALATLWYTAIRRGELIGLDLEDVDFDSHTILVLGKGNKERLVPLHPDLAIILRTYLEDRLTPREGQPLFVSCQRRRLSYETVQKWVKAIGRDAGVPWLHPHVFRHTLATQIMRTTHDVYIVQKLLGHANIATTTRYLHSDVGEIGEALIRSLG